MILIFYKRGSSSKQPKPVYRILIATFCIALPLVRITDLVLLLMSTVVPTPLLSRLARRSLQLARQVVSLINSRLFTFFPVCILSPVFHFPSSVSVGAALTNFPTLDFCASYRCQLNFDCVSVLCRSSFLSPFWSPSCRCRLSLCSNFDFACVVFLGIASA